MLCMLILLPLYLSRIVLFLCRWYPTLCTAWTSWWRRTPIYPHTTYTIQSGKGPIFSYGDVHDPAFDSYGKSQVVFEDSLMAPGR